ncbi:MAG: addiction module protein [Armatimonadetes bacterium]|nr:addiction module protein [Akkermansiaceae bacterium]
MPMVTLAEIETLAFSLPEADRAKLAAELLDSLPGVLVEDDDGLAEALRRSEEMDSDPSACLSHEDFLRLWGGPHDAAREIMGRSIPLESQVTFYFGKWSRPFPSSRGLRRGVRRS